VTYALSKIPKVRDGFILMSIEGLILTSKSKQGIIGFYVILLTRIPERFAMQCLSSSSLNADTYRTRGFSISISLSGVWFNEDLRWLLVIDE
jgi:hypothetical protein